MPNLAPETVAEDMLPDEVIDAIRSAAEEVQAAESWLPEAGEPALHAIPRLVALARLASGMSPEDGRRRMIRQNALKVFAYASPDIRIAAFLDLASRELPILVDALAEPIDGEYEAYRYNVMACLAVFSRHGLLGGALTHERTSRVSAAFARARSARISDKEEDVE